MNKYERFRESNFILRAKSNCYNITIDIAPSSLIFSLGQSDTFPFVASLVNFLSETNLIWRATRQASFCSRRTSMLRGIWSLPEARLFRPLCHPSTSLLVRICCLYMLQQEVGQVVLCTQLGAIDILHKLLQGFSGSLQLKTGKYCWYLTWRQEWQGHYLTETRILRGAIIRLICCLKTKFLNLWARSIRPKFPEIPVENWNRNFPEIRFENFGSPLEVVLNFFWKFRNSGNFLFHLAFLPSMNQPQFF